MVKHIKPIPYIIIYGNFWCFKMMILYDGADKKKLLESHINRLSLSLVLHTVAHYMILSVVKKIYTLLDFVLYVCFAVSKYV